MCRNRFKSLAPSIEALVGAFNCSVDLDPDRNDVDDAAREHPLLTARGMPAQAQRRIGGGGRAEALVAGSTSALTEDVRRDHGLSPYACMQVARATNEPGYAGALKGFCFHHFLGVRGCNRGTRTSRRTD